MEKWKVVGYRICNFKGNDGSDVNGVKLFLARTPVTKGVVGLETLSLFVSGSVSYTPVENQMVMIAFNRYGKVASISPCEA